MSQDSPKNTTEQPDDSIKPVEPQQQMDVYSGVRWSAVAKYGTQAVEVATSLYVARIVAPECYGLLGMAIVITGFLQVFQSLGFGTALIQRKQISDALTSSLFYVNMAVSTLMAVGLAVGAPLFSWIYGDPRVGPVVAVLSVTFIISGLSLVPSALLTRRMAFQRLAWVEIAVSAVRAVAVIALALAGWGVWALVWSSVAGVVVHTILLYMVSDWRPRWLFRWAEVRSVLGFGANLTGFSIFNYFARNADKFIIGAFLGATPLGYYSLAYRILLFPRDAITGVLTRVLFPAFCKMQDDDARLKAAYLRVCGAIAFLTFPMMLGMMVVARPFVEVVLGPKWLPAIPLIYLLAPLGMIQSILGTVGQIYLAKGRANWMFRLVVITGTLHVCGFLIGVNWGVLGVATAYCTTSLLMIPLHLWYVSRLLRGICGDLLMTLLPYAAISIAMAIAVWLCQAFCETILPSDYQTLMVCIAFGAGVYGSAACYFKLPALRDAARLLPRRWLLAGERLGLRLAK